MLRAREITVERAGRRLVDGVSIDVSAGELVGLIGPNGAGKSTLMNVVANLIVATDGYAELHGNKLSQIPAARLSRQLAWVAQSGPVNWPLTVERVVSLGRLPHLGPWQRPQAVDAHAIEAALAATDCIAIREQDASTLSGGERSRMLLARALAVEPDLLLADEPVAALDLGHQLQTMQLLRRYASDSRACLVVLHDLSLAARFCDRLYLLHQGQLAAEGDAQTVLHADNLRVVYGVEVASGFDQVPWIVPVRLAVE